MYKSNIAPKDIEEEELLHWKKEVEMALLEFQRYFLQQNVFYSYMLFFYTSRLVPIIYIKVIHGKQYQALCKQWMEVSITKNACYKVKMDYVHSSGIEGSARCRGTTKFLNHKLLETICIYTILKSEFLLRLSCNKTNIDLCHVY